MFGCEMLEFEDWNKEGMGLLVVDDDDDDELVKKLSIMGRKV